MAAADRRRSQSALLPADVPEAASRVARLHSGSGRGSGTAAVAAGRGCRADSLASGAGRGA